MMCLIDQLYIQMNELTLENQQKVLEYMQAANEQDLANAITIMKNHQFNLQLAIKHQQNTPPQTSNNSSAPPKPTDKQIVMKYIEYAERKGNESSAVRVLYNIFSQLVVDFFRYLGSFLPAFLYIMLFGTPFQRLYRSRTTNKYSHRPLKYYLPKTKQINEQSILLLISPKQPHPDVTAFLNDSEIQEKIKEHFFMCCYLVENKEISAIKGSDECPQVIVLRWNVFQQLVQIGREKDLSNVTVKQLGKWWHQGRNLYRRDGNVLIKCQNFMVRESGIAMETDEQPEIRFVERKHKKQEETSLNQNGNAGQQPISNVEPSEEDKLLAKEEQQRKNEWLQEKRKLLKMSVPEQPTDGIRISFRCPNGSTVMRNFRCDQKIELLFKWVQLNYEISFKKHERKFDILYSSNPLSPKKDQLLSQIFVSQQEKVLIRQL